MADIMGESNVTYTSRDAAKMLDIPVSKLDFYIKELKDIVDLELKTYGKDKRKKITNHTIEKIQWILNLMDEKKYTISQVKEFLQENYYPTEVGIGTVEPEDSQKTKDKMYKEFISKIEENTKMLAEVKSLYLKNMQHFDKQIQRIESQIKDAKTDTTKEIIENQKKLNTEFKTGIENNINSVEKKIEEVSIEMNNNFKNVDTLVETLKNDMDKRKEEYNKSTSNKSFISKFKLLFHLD